MIYIKFNLNNKSIYNSFDDIINLPNYNDILYIDCNNNQLTNLPNLPQQLKDLRCYNNQLPIKYNGNIQKYNTDLQLHNKQKIFINLLQNNYLDTLYNPKFRMKIRQLDNEYDELFN